MFSTEIIINSLLYALNQALTSHIDVLGIIDSAKDLYFQVKELCRSWGITDTMLRSCWQFEEAVWEECEHKFEDTHFTFDSSIGKILVFIYPEDMIFFFNFIYIFYILTLSILFLFLLYNYEYIYHFHKHIRFLLMSYNLH